MDTITGQYLNQFPPLRLDDPPKHVHRLDRPPFPWLRVWTGIAIVCWLIAIARVW